MTLRGLFSRDRRSPAERQFGTGLWRQHRERFSRSVDRFYETASALHSEHGDAALPEVEEIAALTLRFNTLDDEVAALLERCQTAVPLSDLVFPAAGRRQLGDAPEAVSGAAALVAQAAQAAAMMRARLRMYGVESAASGGLQEFPRAAREYADRAQRHIDRARNGVA